MAQQTINVGTTANDGTGDSLRNGFIKTNDNFTELYSNKEDTSNKSTNTSLGTSDVLFPTQKAVKTYVDNQVSGVSTPDATTTIKGKIKLAGDLGGTADLPTVPGLASKIGGSGTDNYIPRFNGTNALENSQIYDNGTSVLVGTTTPHIGGVKFLIYEPSTPTIVGYFQNNNAICYTGYHSATTTLNSVRIGAQGNNLLFSVSSNGSPAERMRIDSNGNVGIGTSSPVTLLDLGSSTGQKLSLYSSGNNKAGFGIETSTLRYYTPTGSIHSFGHLSNTDGTTFLERMRIASDGKVGIGTSTPSTTLQVVGTFKAGDFSNPSLDVGATEISANVDSNKIILNSSSAKLGSYTTGVELGVNTLNGARVYFENSIGNKFGLQESDNLLVTDNGLIQDTVTPSDATTPVRWIRINDISAGNEYLIPVYA
jgi:hypothetical protein